MEDRIAVVLRLITRALEAILDTNYFYAARLLREAADRLQDGWGQ